MAVVGDVVVLYSWPKLYFSHQHASGERERAKLFVFSWVITQGTSVQAISSLFFKRICKKLQGNEDKKLCFTNAGVKLICGRLLLY